MSNSTTAPSQIKKVEVLPHGIVASMDDGTKRTYFYGLVEAADIDAVYVAEDRFSLVIRLRSGDTLNPQAEQLAKE